MAKSIIERVDAELLASPMRGGRTGFWLSSRIHTLPAWPAAVWLKRDDELSCSMSGSKVRKLVSLSAAWQRQRADCVVAWGSARSQHLFALAQLCREQGLELQLVTKAGSPPRPSGLDQLWPWLHPAENRQVVPAELWPEAPERANNLAAALRAQGRQPFLVREGGAQPEAWLGAMSLAVDIVAQEQNLGSTFTHIFVDAGTGLTAQALLIGLALFHRHPCCEIVLCAGKPDIFAADLAEFKQKFSAQSGLDVRALPPYRCHFPPTAKAFGSTNQAIFAEIKRTAEESGVVLDPIYSAKLFMAARAVLPELGSQARVLLIHSGGALSLFGYPLSR